MTKKKLKKLQREVKKMKKRLYRHDKIFKMLKKNPDLFKNNAK
jgi:hypothetical protein